MDATVAGASIPEAAHHRVNVNGTDLHYVEAGSRGSPVLLVHGFPESWPTPPTTPRPSTARTRRRTCGC